DINSPGCHEMLLAPHLSQQLLSRPRRARMGDEELEQLELRRRQLDFFLTLIDATGGAVEAERPRADSFTRRGLAFLAAQVRFDAGHQFTRAERLRHVIVAADLETEDAVDFIGTSGKKDDGRAPEWSGLADPAAKIETILAGEHYIKHDKIRLPFHEIAQRGAFAIQETHVEAAARQVVFDQRRQFGFIFDDGYLPGHASCQAALFAAHYGQGQMWRRWS